MRAANIKAIVMSYAHIRPKTRMERLYKNDESDEGLYAYGPKM
jgi:hypothetical protein